MGEREENQDMPLLTRNRILKSDVTEKYYKVRSNRVAQGGFGEVYRGAVLDKNEDECEPVAIKVSLHPIAWHGEAYFGRLLTRNDSVVQLLDAFPVFDGWGNARKVKYVLVFEWMAEGTVADRLAQDDTAWDEDRVIESIRPLLEVLDLLHPRSICHGDITTRNVFIRDERLMLGDLGITRQSLAEGRRRMHGAPPDDFAPPSVPEYFWSPSDDVYQIALLALALLRGKTVKASEVTTLMLRRLEISDWFMGWLYDALLAKDRFRDAREALECLTFEPVRPARAPSSLRDQRIVITGSLPSMRRDRAEARARRARAAVQKDVNGATTLLVTGEPLGGASPSNGGRKLFDAYRRLRRGQRIAIIDGRRFELLLERERR